MCSPWTRCRYPPRRPTTSCTGTTTRDSRASCSTRCVCEESFFRGLLQRRLGTFLQGRVSAPALTALPACAVAFGVAHFAGGDHVRPAGHGRRHRLRNRLPLHGTRGSRHRGALPPQFVAPGAVQLSVRGVGGGGRLTSELSSWHPVQPNHTSAWPNPRSEVRASAHRAGVSGAPRSKPYSWTYSTPSSSRATPST